MLQKKVEEILLKNKNIFIFYFQTTNTVSENTKRPRIIDATGAQFSKKIYFY
jgi:hypothetical protein